MEFEARSLSPYYFNPPLMELLAGGIEDARRGERGKILFVIASYHDNSRLKGLLAALEEQEFQKFDVLVVYAPDDEFVHSGKLSMLHMRRKEDFGFAGALYLGQLVALRDRYEYFLETDVDRLPCSRSSLLHLYDASERENAQYAIGRIAPQSPDSETARMGEDYHSPFLWGLVRTEVLRATGLYALPLYIGFEDQEFHYRLIKLCKKCVFLGERMFRISAQNGGDAPAFHMKLLRLLRFGGRDNLYVLADLIGDMHMPQAFLDFTKYPSMRLRGKANVVLLAVKRFFIHGLLSRALEYRLPGIGYRERAKRMEFSIITWKNTAGAADLQLVSGDWKAKAGRVGAAKLFHPILNSKSDCFESGFYVLLYDSCVLHDLKDGKAYALTWKNRLPAAKKLVMAALSAIDVAGSICTASANILLGRHAFNGYGKGAVENAAGLGGTP